VTASNAEAGARRQTGEAEGSEPVIPAGGWRPLAIGFAGWLVPGLGHWLLGRRGKALFFLVALWGTFLAGWALSDFRAVFWKYDRIATYGQLGMGVPTVVLLVEREPFSAALGRTFYEPTGPSENLLPYYDVGTLYTCIAGLLNLLVAVNAFSLALLGSRGGAHGGERTARA
jgi:hypothetical protein